MLPELHFYKLVETLCELKDEEVFILRPYILLLNANCIINWVFVKLQLMGLVTSDSESLLLWEARNLHGE